LLGVAARRTVGRQERQILEALGDLGDFVGGLAVIATLIYLAVQVRRNTTALQTASRQEIVAGYRDYNRLSLEPGAALVYAKGTRDYPDMPFEDRARFATMLNDHALFFQGAFALHEAGQLEDETYHAYLNWFACNLITTGGAAWWDEIGRPIFTRRMVQAVEARLAQGQLPDITKLNVIRLDDAPESQAGGENSTSPNDAL
jgi:hypothetical protein